MQRACFFLSLIMAHSVWAAPRVEFAENTQTIKPTKLWTEPTRYGEPIAELGRGIDLKVLSFNASKSWVRVRSPEGREGWLLLRHTSLSGRRDESLFAGRGGAGGPRDPASASGDQPAQETQVLSTTGVALGLGYLNQVNRGATSGLGFGAGFEWALRPGIALGLGAVGAFFSEVEVDQSVATEVSRQSFKIGPAVSALFAFGDFYFSSLAGVEWDRTTVETVDTSTGQIIDVGTGGGRVSGTDTTMGLMLAFEPGFLLAFEDTANTLRLGLKYQLSIDLSSQSASGFEVDESGSRVSHAVGLGLNFVFGL